MSLLTSFSNGVTWATYGLCTQPATQLRLREELLAVNTDTPTYDEINALPYLDAVIRETLRVFSPVPGTIRTVAEDCVLPLSNPIIDKHGKAHTEILYVSVLVAHGREQCLSLYDLTLFRSLSVAKNTSIFLPIVHVNKNKETWGPDAEVFRPERWLETEKLPDGVLEMPSLAFPTFLAGPRACIGFRFSIIE